MALLPTYIGAADPGLVGVLPEELRISRTYWLVVPRDLTELLRVREITQAIRSLAEAHPAMWAPFAVVGEGGVPAAAARGFVGLCRAISRQPLSVAGDDLDEPTEGLGAALGAFVTGCASSGGRSATPRNA